MNDLQKFSTVILSISTLYMLSCSKPATNSVDSVAPATYKSIGVVTAMDNDSGTITIDHEEIAGYMPAMEMMKPVTDLGLLSGLSLGEKVEFEILVEGSTIRYSSIKSLGADALAVGELVYKTNCAECHGVSGQGMEKGIPLTSGHALAHSESEYVDQIRDGEGKKMPAFKDKLTADEIAAVVKYVRESIQTGTAEEQRHHDH